MHCLGEVKNTLPCGKYIQDNMYKCLSESARFLDDVTKIFWCFFRSQFCLLFTCKTRTLNFTR